jgi:hypothetical protein
VDAVTSRFGTLWYASIALLRVYRGLWMGQWLLLVSLLVFATIIFSAYQESKSYLTSLAGLRAEGVVTVERPLPRERLAAASSDLAADFRGVVAVPFSDRNESCRVFRLETFYDRAAQKSEYHWIPAGTQELSLRFIYPRRPSIEAAVYGASGEPQTAAVPVERLTLDKVYVAKDAMPPPDAGPVSLRFGEVFQGPFSAEADGYLSLELGREEEPAWVRYLAGLVDAGLPFRAGFLFDDGTFELSRPDLSLYLASNQAQLLPLLYPSAQRKHASGERFAPAVVSEPFFDAIAGDRIFGFVPLRLECPDTGEVLIEARTRFKLDAGFGGGSNPQQVIVSGQPPDAYFSGWLMRLGSTRLDRVVDYLGQRFEDVPISGRSPAPPLSRSAERGGMLVVMLLSALGVLMMASLSLRTVSLMQDTLFLLRFLGGPELLALKFAAALVFAIAVLVAWGVVAALWGSYNTTMVTYFYPSMPVPHGEFALAAGVGALLWLGSLVFSASVIARQESNNG